VSRSLSAASATRARPKSERIAVRVVERVRDWPQDAHAVVELDRGAEPGGQRPALDILADDVGDAVLLAMVEDGEDVWVLEASDGNRLPVEPRLEAGLLDQELGQDLERDLALEGRLVRAVDSRHPALAKLPEDLVWPDADAGLELHVAMMGQGLDGRK
jgi:hypothetical protein